MTGEREESTRAADDAGRRGGERRGTDRRRTDRRAPPPLWRRPWAYVAYGVVAALVLVFALTRVGRKEEPVPTTLVTTNPPPAVDTLTPPAARAPVQDARTAAAYEELVARGQAAVGQRVRTVLYCRPIHSATLLHGATVTPSVAALADDRGQVPVAECSWGGTPDAPDFLLLVPPALAERFAMSPQVDVGFVRRRRVPAEVQWIGRSEALALRVGGVLEAIGR